MINQNRTAMTKKLGIIICFCAFLFLNPIISQDLLKGKVIDAQTGNPIPYASVQIKNSDYGTITSSAGLFKISRIAEENYLHISCTGYESTELEIRDSVSSLVKLKPAEHTSKSIDNYNPYSLLNVAINKARKQKNDLKARTYISLETYSGSTIPVEILEAFYQSKYSISKGIESLSIKNGRLGMISQNGMLLNSLEATKKLCKIDLFHYSNKENFPISPLSINNKYLKQFFNIEIKEIYQNGNNLIAILEFNPKQTSDEYFSGTIFLDINNQEINKVILKTIDVNQHPFSPFNKQEEISDINFIITFNFRKTNEGFLAYDYINLNYSYKKNDNTTIKTNATLVFMDHTNEYIPIICDINSFTTDYEMIMALPYNNEFWESNDPIIISNYLKTHDDHFIKNGIIVNYSTDESNRYDINNPLVIWKKDSPLILEDINTEQNIQFQQDIYINDMTDNSDNDYFLDIKIVLDCNWIDDTLKGCCQTVFNKSTSFYKPEQTSHAINFINLQFDMAETVRRQLKQTLIKRHKQIDNLNELQNIYNNYISRLKKTQLRLAKEVQLGNNESKMKEWRERIDNELQKVKY